MNHDRLVRLTHLQMTGEIKGERIMTFRLKLFAAFILTLLLGSVVTAVVINMLNSANTVANVLGFALLAGIAGLLFLTLPRISSYFFGSALETVNDVKDNIEAVSEKVKVTRKTSTAAKVATMAMLAFAGAGCTTIEPGHVGIVVNKMGTDRGVESYPQQTGFVFFNPATTSVYQYPTFVQSVVWTRSKDEGHPVNEELSFTTKEGMPITADVSLSYQIKPDKVPYFYVQFRNDDLSQFTHGYLRNLTRDSFNEVASRYSVEEIMGPKMDVFLAEVKKHLQELLARTGVQVDSQFGFVGSPRPPQNIVDSINLKIAATQRAIQLENELRQSTAEAAKAVAVATGVASAQIAAAQGQAASAVAIAKGDAEVVRTRAEATSKANDLINQSINENTIRWKQLEIQRAQIDKWRGEVPNIQTGSTGLMLQLPTK